MEKIKTTCDPLVIIPNLKRDLYLRTIIFQKELIIIDRGGNFFSQFSNFKESIYKQFCFCELIITQLV